jgi:predicted transcriptional regulator
MRTTLTIVDETDARLRRIARDQNRHYKDVVNDALALGATQLEVHDTEPRYAVQTFDAGLAPGIDRTKLNQLVDELEGHE